MESKWISVDDKLPERRKPVFIYSRHHGVLDGGLLYDGGQNGVSVWECGVHLAQDVTHWMPKEYPGPPESPRVLTQAERRFDISEYGGLEYIRLDGNDDVMFPLRYLSDYDWQRQLVYWLNLNLARNAKTQGE
jgi:hypothetical protein